MKKIIEILLITLLLITGCETTKEGNKIKIVTTIHASRESKPFSLFFFIINKKFSIFRLQNYH